MIRKSNFKFTLLLQFFVTEKKSFVIMREIESKYAFWWLLLFSRKLLWRNLNEIWKMKLWNTYMIDDLIWSLRKSCLIFRFKSFRKQSCHVWYTIIIILCKNLRTWFDQIGSVHIFTTPPSDWLSRPKFDWSIT